MTTSVGNYTSKPKVNDQVKNFYFERITTTSLLPRTDSEPITFIIPSIEGLFIDLNQIYLNVKFKVLEKKANGTTDKIGKTEEVAPYNLFLYTLWSELEIEFNSELIESTKFNYQLQTYLKILLNSTEAMRKSILQNALYFKDLAGALSLVHRTNKKLSPGNYLRAEKVSESKICEMRGKVISDIFNVNKPLIDGVNMLLRFYPEQPNKCLISSKAAGTPSYQIDILSAELIVGRLQPKVRNVPTAIYPFIKTRCQRHIHPKAIQEFGPITIASGILPVRAYVVIISEDEFLGNVKKHRLSFKHFNINHIAMIVNGELKPFKQGYNPDFKNDLYSDAYFGLLHESGKQYADFDLPIGYEDYKDGFCIFEWDLTSNHGLMDENQYGEASSGGLLQLKADFEKAPTENLCIYVLLDYEMSYTIRKDRTFVMDEKPQKTQKK